MVDSIDSSKSTPSSSPARLLREDDVFLATDRTAAAVAFDMITENKLKSTKKNHAKVKWDKSNLQHNNLHLFSGNSSALIFNHFSTSIYTVCYTRQCS